MTVPVASNATLGAAISYAARGWFVLPLYGIRDGLCTCGNAECNGFAGKHPRLREWTERATTDPDVLRGWWTKWPESNVGILTGFRSGLVVLDVDPRNGGDDSLERLIRDHGPLPETVESLTGGGGRHILFGHLGGKLPKKAGLRPGLDLCADGAQIVAPPSVHRSGRTYAWELAHHPDDVELAKLPVWLAVLATSREKSLATADGPTGPVIPAGRRDVFMISLGGLLRRHGLDQGAIEAVLRHANESVVEQPNGNPFSDAEVTEKARSATRYEPEVEAEAKPEIVVRPRLQRVVQEAEDAIIADKSVGVYTRAGILVKVIRDGARRIAKLTRPPGAPVIVAAEAAWLREILDKVAIWVRHTRRSGGIKKVQSLPPDWAVNTLAARGEWGLPALEGVIETPVMRPDGSIVDSPGYDAQTGLLYDPGGTEFRPIPEEPTSEDAGRAMLELLEPFAEFDFVTPADQAVATAALFTLLARPAIAGPVPLFAFRAPTPGSGKSLLADVITMIATGRPAARMAPPTSDEEARKLILALAIEGAPVVLVDNANGIFGSQSVSAALTATTWSDRLLGFSKTLTAPLRMTWFLTGNNVTFKGDLGRRVVPCDLDPKVEHPEDRTGFRHPDLLAHVARERARIVVASLTVLRAYHVSGRPRHGRPPKGTFEAWDQLVRGALLWVGMSDPLESAQRIRDEGDADLDSLRQGLAAWAAAFDSEPKTAAEAVEQIAHSQDLGPALGALSGCGVAQLDARRLGYALRRVRGRRVGGLRFEVGTPTRTKAQRWKVEKDVADPPDSAERG